MTQDELVEKLVSNGIRNDAYSLNGPSDEAYCLERAGSGFSVYYFERGVRSGERVFRSESEAFDHLAELLLSDGSVR